MGNSHQIVWALLQVFSKLKATVGIASLWYTYWGLINPGEVSKMKEFDVKRPKTPKGPFAKHH